MLDLDRIEKALKEYPRLPPRSDLTLGDLAALLALARAGRRLAEAVEKGDWAFEGGIHMAANEGYDVTKDEEAHTAILSALAAWREADA